MVDSLRRPPRRFNWFNSKDHLDPPPAPLLRRQRQRHRPPSSIAQHLCDPTRKSYLSDLWYGAIRRRYGGNQYSFDFVNVIAVRHNEYRKIVPKIEIAIGRLVGMIVESSEERASRLSDVVRGVIAIKNVDTRMHQVLQRSDDERTPVKNVKDFSWPHPCVFSNDLSPFQDPSGFPNKRRT